MKNTLTKRFLSLLLAVLTIASGLSLTVGATETHTHSANGVWKSDDVQHWQLCTCGAVVESTRSNHLAEGAWLNDATNHWRLCGDCGAVAVSAKHVDKDKNELCDDCKYNMHVHVATGTWLKDATNHWKLCKCGEVALSGAHTENASGYCTVCQNYVHVHAAQGEWLKDAENHWKLCKCGQVAVSAAHADANSDKTCDDCGAAVHTHAALDRWLNDGTNHWQLCECGVAMNSGAHVDANTDKVCDTCKFNMAGNVHVCAPQGDWKMDAKNHWLVCSCGKEQYYLAAHTMSGGKCIACGYPTNSGTVVNGNWSVTVAPGCTNATHNHNVVTSAYNANYNEAKAAVLKTFSGASITGVEKITLPASNIKVGVNSVTVGNYTLTPGELISIYGKTYIVDYVNAGTRYVRFISVGTNKTIVYDTITKSVQTVFEDTPVRKIAAKVSVNGVEYDAFYLYGGNHYYLYKNGNPAGVANSVSATFHSAYAPSALSATASNALVSFTYGYRNYVVYDIFSEIISMNCVNYPAVLNVSVNLSGAAPVAVIGGITNNSSSYVRVPVSGNTATLTLRIARSTPVAMFAVVSTTVVPASIRNIVTNSTVHDCWWDIVNHPSCPGVTVKPGCTLHPVCSVYPGCVVKPGCSHFDCVGHYECIAQPTRSYVISASSNVGGTMSPAGNAVIVSGQSMTYKFTPAEGFAISKVIVDGVNVGRVTSYTFRNVNRHHTLKVEFAKVKIPFLDVYTTDWYYDDVVYVWGNDIMQGTEYTKFDPKGDITRGMIVTMLWRLEGEPASLGTQFKDVGSASYYADAVRWAAKNGIVCGYGDDTFRPNQNITREELAVILYRYLEFKGEGFVGSWAYRLGYEDVSDISSWAIEAISYLTMKNIVVTDSSTKLDPATDASRAEAAVCIHRVCEFLAD